MKSILLITHDTSLSGAPKSILLVLEIFKKNGFQISTLTMRGGGKLENRFKEISHQFYCVDGFSKKKNYTLKNRFKRKFFKLPILSEYEIFLNSISEINKSLIYCNTIVSLSLGVELKIKNQCKLILHVHELKTVIDMVCPEIKSYEQYIDLFIVPSVLNKKCLIKDFGISEQKIKIIRETTEITSFERKKINVTKKINVLMCGGAYWRKGDDIFILVANRIVQKDKRFRFFWVGNQSEERKMVNNADIIKLDLQEYVQFIDETNDVSNWYEKSDLFLLTSREDSFPLAAIEAGMMGLPIVCFDQATGIAEVIDKNCVISYLDIDSMANRVINIIKNEDEYRRLSAENRITFGKFIPELIAASILSEVQNLIKINIY